MGRIVGTEFADNLLDADPLPDRFTGLAGNDTITAGDTDDTLIGGVNENDLPGGTDDDLLFGNGGDDVIVGGAGADTIVGGDGDDTIGGASDGDIIVTGFGDDRVRIAGTEEVGGADVHTGDGNDRVLVSGVYRAPGTSTVATVSGGDGNDRLHLKGAFGTLDGGAGNDTIILSGFGGTLLVTQGIGGDGDDTLSGAAPGDVYDVVDADDFDQYSPGGPQLFDGGAGNDLMIAYDFTIDTFVIRPDEGRDRIRNFSLGDDDASPDWLDLSAFGFGTAEEVIDLYAVARGDRTILTFGADARVTITGTTPADLADHIIV